ncbi:MAG: hypothetical protein BWY31_01388 [Lentisphaerae bacterium ADurb.Bin242]|nr:MAG: hypothetical protein BWY31_01388 [Lentisphaerae bacterium ADurb.Bin242]
MRYFYWVLPAMLCAAAPAADPSSRREVSKLGTEFSDMAREIRVNRRVQEQLEDQASIVEYAVKHEQLSPAELKRIRAVMDRIEAMRKKMNQSGKMTAQEAAQLQQEISKAYRMIWFLRRNQLGSTQPIVFLGRPIILREEYRKKYDKGSLNQKEMAEILRVYYSAWRIQERMQSTNIQPELRKRLEKECFDTLSEYFELAPAAPDKDKGKK